MNMRRSNAIIVACVLGLTTFPSAACRAGWNVGASVSGAWHEATGTVSDAAQHAGGVVSGAAQHAGGVVSGATHHAGGVVSGATHHAGGVVSGATHHAGGVVSGATHHAATVLGNTNPEIKKALKGPGVNENTVIRETYQGAGAGALEGFGIGFATGGPLGAAAGTASGGVGGAAEGLGQGIFDTNKDYFRDRDPGKHLPRKYRPNTGIRVGYQEALKAAAGTVIGGYTASSLAPPANPLEMLYPTESPVTPVDVGKSAAFGALSAEVKKNTASTVKWLRQQPIETATPIHAPSPLDYRHHVNAVTNSVSALQRAGHFDPRRPVRAPQLAR
jgi:hypothetical protein